MMLQVLFVSSLSTLLTWQIRRFARSKALMDLPNERSSHSVATPHGGGVAVMVALGVGLLWAVLQNGVERSEVMPVVAVIPIVVISLIDDLRPLGARVRLLVQAASALLALELMGGVERMDFGLFVLESIWLNAGAFLMILWMTNLYNFLDGIDGYAGSEALFVGLASFWLFGSDVGLLIAAAAAGFLIFNWHRASIFMGDVGSAPLGFIFAVLALQHAATPKFTAWLLLLSLFWFDATVTLLRRWRNKERLSVAHRKHAYQRLHQAGWSHDRIVLAGMSLNGMIFMLLWIAGPHRYGVVFLIAIALLWAAMKYVDRQKDFS